jgi:hypothetical protein
VNRIRCVCLFLCLLPLLSGCGVPGQTNGTGASPTNDAADDATGDGGVDIRGTITNIQQTDGRVNSVRIEGTLEADTAYDKAVITITDQTRILKQEGQEHVPAAAEELKVGQRVEARFIGPVAESYPVQATANKIVILE